MIVAMDVDGTPHKSKMSRTSSFAPHAITTSSSGMPNTGLTGLFCDSEDEEEA
jgi:hypothetical protein